MTYEERVASSDCCDVVPMAGFGVWVHNADVVVEKDDRRSYFDREDAITLRDALLELFPLEGK